jgi:hypothetical protein
MAGICNPLILLVRPARFELAASRFVVWRSIQLSHGRVVFERTKEAYSTLSA